MAVRLPTYHQSLSTGVALRIVQILLKNYFDPDGVSPRATRSVFVRQMGTDIGNFSPAATAQSAWFDNLNATDADAICHVMPIVITVSIPMLWRSTGARAASNRSPPRSVAPGARLGKPPVWPDAGLWSRPSPWTLAASIRPPNGLAFTIFPGFLHPGQSAGDRIRLSRTRQFIAA